MDIYHKTVQTSVRITNRERKTVYQPGLYATIVKKQVIGKGNVQNWKKKMKNTAHSVQEEDEYDVILACKEFENNPFCVLIEESEEEDLCDEVHLETEPVTFEKIG